MSNNRPVVSPAGDSLASKRLAEEMVAEGLTRFSKPLPGDTYPKVVPGLPGSAPLPQVHPGTTRLADDQRQTGGLAQANPPVPDPRAPVTVAPDPRIASSGADLARIADGHDAEARQLALDIMRPYFPGPQTGAGGADPADLDSLRVAAAVEPSVDERARIREDTRQAEELVRSSPGTFPRGIDPLPTRTGRADDFGVRVDRPYPTPVIDNPATPSPWSSPTANTPEKDPTLRGGRP